MTRLQWKRLMPCKPLNNLWEPNSLSCDKAPGSYGIHLWPSSTNEIYIHTRSDGKQLNFAHERARAKGTEIPIRYMLFVTHTEKALQRLISCLLKFVQTIGSMSD
ncbi:hypothetical protein DPMN_005496 [Dreissena polymorpha]|uniref:Uncharacterized protein n=1 Tax=Dreissena polymorpha TaxID=45954 RepID=A0A9D4MQH2_DREPO|nr:hypothetical protein DPMN_005496 [Dreissena polymorpha]